MKEGCRAASLPRLVTRVVPFFIITVLGGGCSLFSPFGRPDPPPVIHLTATQSGQLIDIKEGRMLAVHLSDDREGLSWVFAGQPDHAVLDPQRRTGREEMHGVPMVVFYLTAESPGITSFRLERRGAGIETAEEFELTVRVTY